MLRHDPAHSHGPLPRLLAVEQLEPRRPFAVLSGVDIPLFQPGGEILDPPTPGTGIPGTASIAGTVFEANRLVAPFESVGGMGGVTVRLLDNQGRFVAESTTDAAGGYAFPGLDAGWYGVQQVQPAGYYDGRSMQGTGGGVTLSANLIGDINLAAGAALVGYDFADVRIEPAAATLLQPAADGLVLPLIVDVPPAPGLAAIADDSDDSDDTLDAAPAVVVAVYDAVLPKLEVEPAGIGGSCDERLLSSTEKTDNSMGVESVDEALRLRGVDQTVENEAPQSEAEPADPKPGEPRTARGQQQRPASEPERRAEADLPRERQEDEAVRVAAISSL